MNGNVIEEGKEPVPSSKLTLTEALAAESGGTPHLCYHFTEPVYTHVNYFCPRHHLSGMEHLRVTG